jgi:hypothetical protein
LWLAILLVSAQVFAVPVQLGTTDFTLNVDANLQLRLEETGGGPPPTATSGAAPSGHYNFDIFFRRASLSIRGTGLKVFTYYLKLETGRFGLRGNYSSSTQIQDAYIGYVPFPDFNIEGGFLKTPLSRPAVDSSERSNSLEGVSDILLYPNTRAQRQMGLQVRSLLFNQWFLIRGGIYEGARNGYSGGNPTTPPFPIPATQNPNGWPMIAGMARVNLLGYENPYTYPGIYLDGISRASFGVGGQYQSKSGAVNRDGTINDYTALSADVFADIALPGDSEAVLTLDGYRFDYGTGQAKTGYGAHGEIGYRWGHIEPQGSAYWFNSETKKNSFLRLAGGLTYFIKGHTAKIMFEYENTIMNGVLPNTPGLAPTKWLHQFLLQIQLHV